MVELTAFGEAGNVTVQQAVRVFESPQAAFIVQPTRVFIPGNPVIGFNRSIGDNLTYHLGFWGWYYYEYKGSATFLR